MYPSDKTQLIAHRLISSVSPPERHTLCQVSNIACEGYDDDERKSEGVGLPHTPSSSASFASLNRTPAVRPDEHRSVLSGGQRTSCGFEPSVLSVPLEGAYSSVPRLKRGFSNTLENEEFVSVTRQSVLNDINEDLHDQMSMTFVLPDLSVYEDGFVRFLKSELIDSTMLTSLQLSAMWGIHDRQLTLRIALHHMLTKSGIRDRLYRRWRWQQTLQNLQSSLVYSEEEWETEWYNIVHLASSCPRGNSDVAMETGSKCDRGTVESSSNTNCVKYESLEEMHVFVLAHVLQRPILVVADAFLRDSDGEALAPIPFGGIYLPLEIEPANCCASPVMLAYDAAHFSALVPMATSFDADDGICSSLLAVPVVDRDNQLLSLHFSHDPGQRYHWASFHADTADDTLACESNDEDSLSKMDAYLALTYLPVRDPWCSSHHFNYGAVDGLEVMKANHLSWKKKKAGVHAVISRQLGLFSKSFGRKLKYIGHNINPGRHRVGKIKFEDEVYDANRTLCRGRSAEEVYCARLNCDRNGSSDWGFVENYLNDAQCRFSSCSTRGNADPPVSLLTSVRRSCRTPGCNNSALVNIALCVSCHQLAPTVTSRQAEFSTTKTVVPTYNTFPGRRKVNQSPRRYDGGILKCGQSKFYTTTQHDLVEPQISRLRPKTRDCNSVSTSAENVRPFWPSLRREDTSNSEMSIADHCCASQFDTRCKTKGCQFYANKQLEGLCSMCYRNTTCIIPQLAEPENSSHL